MTEENDRRLVLDWLHASEAKADAEAWEMASGAVVMTRNTDTGHVTMSGPHTVVDAMQVVTKIKGEFHDMPEVEVTMHPLWPPDRT